MTTSTLMSRYAFSSLLYADHGWRPVWLAFTAFDPALILARLTFGHRDAFGQLRQIGAAMSKTEAPERQAFAQWSKELRTWNQERDRNVAKQAGWKLALLVFAGVWTAADLLGITFPGFINFFAFAWNPAPDFLHPGIALGALAGWAAGVYRVFYLQSCSPDWRR
jgi:hypothetical protein